MKRFDLNLIGQGTWGLGESRTKYSQEKEALTEGINRGLRLIDTAEMYGEGLSEILVGDVVKNFKRDDLYLVSKVYPHNAGRANIVKSCENSLKRLKTDYLDLYLLHWRGRIPLTETVEMMEYLVKEGKIRNWGVSNFDTDDMKELFNVPDGKKCLVNQILYNPLVRGPEFDLIPWMDGHGVSLMAYSPLGNGGAMQNKLLHDPVLKSIAESRKVSVSEIILAFIIRNGKTIAIPKSSSKEHTILNAKSDKIRLTDQEIQMIEKTFPKPKRKTPLEML